MERCKNITIIFLLAVGMRGSVAFANSSSTTFRTLANSDMGISDTAKLATELTSIDGKPISIPEMEAVMTGIMKKARIPGLSCSIINRSKVAYCKTFGLKNNKTGELNDGQTIFVAASFSKTVFAYLGACRRTCH